MSELSKEGALYELLIRGNKDVYFQSDTLTALSPFRNNYKRIPGFIHELRKIPPINNADFGKVVEFEFEVAGDIFTHPTLLIDLPTWLPSEYASINDKSVITDNSGNTYGYTKAIGYFLFSNIQIYQDQILLQEFSGDALYASRLSRGSYNSSMLENKLLGSHNGSTLSIGRNATPYTLRLELPLIGCQHIDDGGFPSLCVRSQTFRLRLTLRKLEDLVESSNSQKKPTPWDRSDFKIQTVKNGSFTTFSTLNRYNIDKLSLYLETRHIYVDPETQKEFIESSLEYPFSRLYENILYFIRFGYENEKDISNFFHIIKYLNVNIKVHFINVYYNKINNDYNYTIINNNCFFVPINFYLFEEKDKIYNEDDYYRTLEYNWDNIFKIINLIKN